MQNRFARLTLVMFVIASTVFGLWRGYDLWSKPAKNIREVRHLERLSGSAPYSFGLRASATRRTIRDIFHLMGVGSRLDFQDHQAEPTAVGVHVIMCRADKGTFHVRGGTANWTGGWFPLTEKEARCYLWKNHIFNQGLPTQKGWRTDLALKLSWHAVPAIDQASGDFREYVSRLIESD